MKNYLLLLSCLFIAGFSKAQFTTGQRLIGAQFGAGFSADNITNAPGIEQHNNYFTSSFSFSRFKSPTLFTGFGISFSHNHFDGGIGTPVNEQIDNNNDIGAFINFTKLQPLARKLYLGFTATVGIDYGFAKTSFSQNASSNKTNNYAMSVSGGLDIVYQLNERFLFNVNIIKLVNLLYSYTTIDLYSATDVTKYYISRFNINSGLNGFSFDNLTVGVKYMLK